MLHAPMHFHDDGFLHLRARHDPHLLLMVTDFFLSLCFFFRHCLLLAFFLAQNRQQSRPVFSQLAHFLQRFGLAHGPLKSQLEHLFTHFRLLPLQFVGRHVAKFFCSICRFHSLSPLSSRSWRMTNFVCTGSFWAARRIASRATDSGTPSIS